MSLDSALATIDYIGRAAPFAVVIICGAAGLVAVSVHRINETRTYHHKQMELYREGQRKTPPGVLECILHRGPSEKYTSPVNGDAPLQQ